MDPEAVAIYAIELSKKWDHVGIIVISRDGEIGKVVHFEIGDDFGKELIALRNAGGEAVGVNAWQETEPAEVYYIVEPYPGLEKDPWVLNFLESFRTNFIEDMNERGVLSAKKVERQ